MKQAHTVREDQRGDLDSHSEDQPRSRQPDEGNEGHDDGMKKKRKRAMSGVEKQSVVGVSLYCLFFYLFFSIEVSNLILSTVPSRLIRPKRNNLYNAGTSILIAMAKMTMARRRGNA